MEKLIEIEIYEVKDCINLRAVNGEAIGSIGSLIIIMNGKAYAKSWKETTDEKDVYVELLDLADTIKVNAPGIFDKIS